MQPNDDAIRTWLWMQAMDMACEDIWRQCQYYAVPDEKDRRFMKLDDLIERSYRYALSHWQDAVHAASTHGRASGDRHYCTGCWINADCHGVSAEFHPRCLEVSITYADVRQFIERLLSPPTMEERQMTMLEIMSMVGCSQCLTN